MLPDEKALLMLVRSWAAQGYKSVTVTIRYGDDGIVGIARHDPPKSKTVKLAAE